jgi:hemoglobin/transferrin/lactoferrin receptor protein
MRCRPRAPAKNKKVGLQMAGTTWRARALLGSVSALTILTSALATSASAQVTVLDAITIIATKTEELAINALAPVSTVRGDQIQQIQARKTSDLFFGIPGVTFQERGDDPATAINIRGLQDFGRVAVLIDGARQNHQRTGHNADGLFYLDPAVIGGVDVVRGPTANIYGSGAIGGVVSFRTIDVQDVLAPGQKWGSVNNVTVHNNLWGINTSTFYAARPTDNVDFVFGGSLRHDDRYRDADTRIWPNTDRNNATVLGKLTVRPADGHEVKFSALQGLFDFRNGIPTSGTTTVFDSQIRNTVTSARWTFARPDDNLRNFDIGLYYTETDAKFTKIQGTAGSPVNGSIGDSRFFTVKTVGIDANNTSRFATGALNHAFTYGVDAFHDRVDVRDPVGTGDLFTPSGERTVSGGFLQLKSNYSSWLEIISAARYDQYSLNGGTGGSSGDRLSPKITVGVTPVRGIQPYVTYAEGYRAPAVTEAFVTGQHPFLGPGSDFVFLANLALRPEVGKNAELGINFKFDNIFRTSDAFRAKVNYFRNNVSDFIEQTAVANGATGQGGMTCANASGCLQYQNISQAEIEGFEFESKYDAGLWYLGVAGQHIRGQNAVTAAPLLRIQPDQVATTFGMRFLENRLQFAVRWAAVSAKERADIPPVTGTPTYPPVGSYNLVNLYVAYQANQNTTWHFGIDNLLNEQYARYMDVYPGAGQVTTAFPSAGLTVKGGVTIKFGDGVPLIPYAVN